MPGGAKNVYHIRLGRLCGDVFRKGFERARFVSNCAIYSLRRQQEYFAMHGEGTWHMWSKEETAHTCALREMGGGASLNDAVFSVSVIVGFETKSARSLDLLWRGQKEAPHTLNGCVKYASVPGQVWS